MEHETKTKQDFDEKNLEKAKSSVLVKSEESDYKQVAKGKC
jgi:hypothetical protein